MYIRHTLCCCIKYTLITMYTIQLTGMDNQLNCHSSLVLGLNSIGLFKRERSTPLLNALHYTLYSTSGFLRSIIASIGTHHPEPEVVASRRVRVGKLYDAENACTGVWMFLDRRRTAELAICIMYNNNTSPVPVWPGNHFASSNITLYVDVFWFWFRGARRNKHIPIPYSH